MIEKLFQNLKSFAEREPVIRAIVLIGSFARGTAGPQSDVDLVVIASKPEKLLNDRDWVEQFGEACSCVLEDYSLVQSLRVFYKNGMEVEFGITSLDWIAETELKSTGKILSGGYRVIYDPGNLIDAFFGRVE